MYHGEKVAFGVITQLVLENALREELNQVLDFCISVGLPVTMAQIGVTEPTEEKIRQVAEIACAESDTARNMPSEVNPDMIVGAIWASGRDGKGSAGSLNAKVIIL